MEEKHCSVCGNLFQFTANEREIVDKIAPVFGENKYVFSDPTLCYSCRLQRRFAWRNDRNLYKRKCSISGAELITMFPADALVPVIDKDIWWGDDWDPLEYGRDYDFSQTFMEQFAAMMRQVPHPHTFTIQAENSLYTNYNLANKNCYLCFTGNYLEDSLYCYNAEKSQLCMDCFFVLDCTLGYELVHCNSCYNVAFLSHCKNCTDSYFLEDCHGCKNCFMCCNLRQKQYCMKNVQYTKEEYEQKINEYDLRSHSGLERARSEWEVFRRNCPKPSNHNEQIEDCTGEYITKSKHCTNCYIVQKDCEDISNVFNAFPALKDSLDCTFCGENSSLMYECMGSGSDAQRYAFCVVCIGVTECYYCNLCFSCKHCFGCSCLRGKEYCIFNKQYTKEEYEKQVPKIIEHMQQTGEWGEFFDPQYSPLAYNETVAHEYFPLDQEMAEKRGFHWRNAEDSGQRHSEYVPEDTIDKVPESIVQERLLCTECGRNYRIVREEYEQLQRRGFPIPHVCFDCRHRHRMHLSNGPKMHQNTCSKCHVDIMTAHAKDSGLRVYCEKCYLEEVY